jgi:hypothetical protein
MVDLQVQLIYTFDVFWVLLLHKGKSQLRASWFKLFLGWKGFLAEVRVAIGIGLRQVQQALDRKADAVQQQFIDLSDQLDNLTHEMLEAPEEDRLAIKEKQKQLRADQLVIADEVNEWRTRARKVLTQPGVSSLRAYLNELLEMQEELVTPAVERALMLLDLPPEERIQHEAEEQMEAQTPAGRLIERGRTDFDLRSSDSGVRQREAITFANKAGMAQDTSVLEEIAAAIDDPDPLVKELAVLTTIQLYRFRATRFADLELAHDATQYLARMNHPAVVPVLIEILENPRVGYMEEEGESMQKDNSRSRMVALLRLVEWHTAEAQAALKKLKFDRDPHIIKAAERALELFPGPWAGKFNREMQK